MIPSCADPLEWNHNAIKYSNYSIKTFRKNDKEIKVHSVQVSTFN